MQRRPDVYLELALNALRRVPRYLGKRTEAEYLADDYCQSAVERQLEIAGDSLGQLRKIAPELFKRVPDGDLGVAKLRKNGRLRHRTHRGHPVLGYT
jgi:uncharacterized protein with HEPN domain